MPNPISIVSRVEARGMKKQWTVRLAIAAIDGTARIIELSGDDRQKVVLADSGIAVIVISSHVPETLALSDCILVARQGRIVKVMGSHSATGQRTIHAAVH